MKSKAQRNEYAKRPAADSKKRKTLGRKVNLKNYARSYLIMYIIGFIISLIFFFTFLEFY